MGIKLIEAASKSGQNVTASSRRGGARTRAKVLDLPLPRGGQGSVDWNERFVPSLLSWAGSHEDPFGTNGQMDAEITSLWLQIYPGRKLGDGEQGTVRSVVRDSTICL